MLQPDVSAFTILEMMRQLGHDADLLEGALGSVYDEVRRLGGGTGFMLEREGKPIGNIARLPEVIRFTSRDASARLHVFAQQATMRAETQTGPLEGNWPERTATGAQHRLTLAFAPQQARFVTLSLWTTES